MSDPSLPLGTSFALGLAVGGAWNGLNLWCLARALTVWLTRGAARRRSIAWFLVKFPLLYAAAFWTLSRPEISPVGFAAGFTLILALAGLVMLRRSQALVPPLPVHGR